MRERERESGDQGTRRNHHSSSQLLTPPNTDTQRERKRNPIQILKHSKRSDSVCSIRK